MPEERTRKNGKKTEIEKLKRGNQPGYHLLNKSIDDGFEDYMVVDFRNVYGIQISALLDIVSRMKNRKRLLSPYKEHLSQAFARYFMRVGLPQDINIDGYW